MNKMENDLMKACSMYCEICERTNEGDEKGMPIREIKKKYGLKKRDIVVLLQFLLEIAELDSSVEFIEYTEDGRAKDVNLTDVENTAGKGDVYIRIMDRGAYMPKERMDGAEFNIRNSTLINNLNQIDISNILKEISNISEEELAPFIVNKGEKRKNILEKRIKQKLIYAILNRNVIQITEFGEKVSKKKIYPLGLQYVKLLDTYKLIYSETLHQPEKEMEILKISKIEILKEKYERKFSIHDFVRKKNTQKVVLFVYREGNVSTKLDLILSEYEVKKIEKQNYVEYHFWVENADMFEKMIKSFGRSVIVKEPEYLREKIYRNTKEILDFYMNNA